MRRGCTPTQGRKAERVCSSRGLDLFKKLPLSYLFETVTVFLMHSMIFRNQRVFIYVCKSMDLVFIKNTSILPNQGLRTWIWLSWIWSWFGFGFGFGFGSGFDFRFGLGLNQIQILFEFSFGFHYTVTSGVPKLMETVTGLANTVMSQIKPLSCPHYSCSQHWWEERRYSKTPLVLFPCQKFASSHFPNLSQCLPTSPT